jgi:hypothetical protein
VKANNAEKQRLLDTQWTAPPQVVSIVRCGLDRRQAGNGTGNETNLESGIRRIRGRIYFGFPNKTGVLANVRVLEKFCSILFDFSWVYAKTVLLRSL